jgi:hypothetical protein
MSGHRPGTITNILSSRSVDRLQEKNEINWLTMVSPVGWLVLVGLYGLFAPIHVFELPEIVGR